MLCELARNRCRVTPAGDVPVLAIRAVTCVGDPVSPVALKRPIAIAGVGSWLGPTSVNDVEVVRRWLPKRIVVVAVYWPAGRIWWTVTGKLTCAPGITTLPLHGAERATWPDASLIVRRP